MPLAAAPDGADIFVLPAPLASFALLTIPTLLAFGGAMAPADLGVPDGVYAGAPVVP